MAEFSTNPGDRSASELEREVNEERARLSETIDALQEKASVGNIVDQVMRAIGDNGGQVSRNLGRSLRDNPLPALLTGVGLVWLMAGSGRPASSRRDWEDFDDEDLYGDEETYAGDYYRGDEAGAYAGSTPSSDYQARPTGYGTLSADTTGLGDTGDEEDRAGMLERASEAGAGLRERASEAGAGLRERASEFRHGAQDRLSSAGGAVRGASEAARRRAAQTRRRMMRAGHDAREGLDSLIEEQPLVLGALALAVGAALGGALPRSRTEDRMFGAQSDRAKRSVRTMAEEEGRKVRATAGAVAAEAQHIADEAAGEVRERMPGGRDMVEQAEARLGDAAARLREAGEKEAERQNLGRTGSERQDPGQTEAERRDLGQTVKPSP